MLLLTGLLIGEAKAGSVRAAVFAPPAYQPRRLSDLLSRHKLSAQAFCARLAQVALARLYPQGLPRRLFGIADLTHVEKPYARRVASLGWFRRTKAVAGRSRSLKGHAYVLAAHLFRHGTRRPRWAAVLVGALVYIKGRSPADLVGQLAQHLRLPATVRHVWLLDRGLVSRRLLRQLAELGHAVIGRLRAHQVVYFAPPANPARRGRQALYGAKCRVDHLLTEARHRLQCQSMQLKIGGRPRAVRVWSAVVHLRGVWAGRALAARVIVIQAPGLRQRPWYLLTTDLELDAVEAVQAYDGRYQIEVNIDEAKELGLGDYRGRSGRRVRRWPLLVCAAQMILKLVATEVVKVSLPPLNWEWYRREDTVGQVRRRLIEYCRPRISRRVAENRPAEKCQLVIGCQ